MFTDLERTYDNSFFPFMDLWYAILWLSTLIKLFAYWMFTLIVKFLLNIYTLPISPLHPAKQVKQPALFSQYGEVRKVEPPAVGPRESVRYGWGRFSPRYSANGWVRVSAVCLIHWTAASVMFQSLVITLFVDVSPTRSVTGRPSCLSRNGTSLVHASTRLLNREVFAEIITNNTCSRQC